MSATTSSAGDELESLGWQINAHQHRAVHLAARYEEEQEWFGQGFTSAATGIAQRLQIQPSTAREWIRVGHMLRYLPLIDAAFVDNDISYAKVRILTRWADEGNEQQLLELAAEHSAGRLTCAIAKALDHDDDDGEARDRRHHEDRGLTSYTDGDGMVVIRLVLPPAIAKTILAIITTLVERIARTPIDATDAPAGAPQRPSVVEAATVGESGPPAGASLGAALPHTLRQLRRRWQPEPDDDWVFPTVAQQRADAFCALFIGLDDVEVTTEVVIHVRGDGSTFDDGTPISTNAVARLLDGAFVRALIHEERTPIDATNRRRFATARQQHVVMETHGHRCVDCGATDHLELDHDPPFQVTGHTITAELAPRCATCHRARHRRAA